MKIQKRAINHPSKVFWYCKVCKARKEGLKSKKKDSVYPFRCSRNVKRNSIANMLSQIKDIKDTLLRRDSRFGCIIK